MKHRRLLPVLALALGAVLAMPASAAAQEDEPGSSDTRSDTRIVPSRAPAEKNPPKVRGKFFYKKKRLEISPHFGYVVNNALNTEVVAGLKLAYHFDERIAVEVDASYAFLGGANNTRNLATAVLQLVEPAFRLESVDPGLFVTANFVWSPMYGKINPFGLAVINLDFYFLLGLGYGNENVEMLRLTRTAEGADVAELDEAGGGLNHLFLINFGFGAQVYATRWLSLRLEARLYLTWDQVLNFDDDAANEDNSALDPVDRHRLLCHDDTSGAVCKTTFPTTFVVGVGGSFWAPGQKAVLARERRR